MPDLMINGIPARALAGFILDSAPGWLDAPARQTATVQIPGRAGVTPIAESAEQARRITLRGVIRGVSVADCRLKIDALRAALFTPSLVLSFPDHPTRFVYASVESFPVQPGNGASMIADTLGVEIVVALADPYSYDTAVTTRSVTNAGAGDVPLGTGPSRPLLSLAGPATSPAIRTYDLFGSLVGQMVFNGLALAAGQTLVIDCDAMTIAINGVNAVSALTAGDFLVFEPGVMGTINNPATPPTITVTSGVLSVSYRKAWR